MRMSRSVLSTLDNGPSRSPPEVFHITCHQRTFLLGLPAGDWILDCCMENTRSTTDVQPLPLHIIICPVEEKLDFVDVDRRWVILVPNANYGNGWL